MSNEQGGVGVAIASCIAGFIIVVVVGLGFYFLVYGTAEGRGRIALHNQQRSADNLQFNYEYFHDKCHAIIAETSQIETLKRQLGAELAAPPASDPFGQNASMLIQLRGQVSGLENIRDADAQDYNSKSHQFTRNFIKSRDLPAEIGPPNGDPYVGLVCEAG